MPKVTIWIRNEDYDKWLALENKPEWLHGHLVLTKIMTPKEVNPKSSKFRGTETFDTMISIPTIQESSIDEPKLTPPEEAA
jgi:hypothetical protein